MHVIPEPFTPAPAAPDVEGCKLVERGRKIAVGENGALELVDRLRALAAARRQMAEIEMSLGKAHLPVALGQKPADPHR